MPDPEHTHWSLIRRAARGDGPEQEEFARSYEPVIRAYLASRWRGSRLLGEIDDATQEVFVACFRPDGALGRADPERPSGFRAFLYGIAKNVARRVEEKLGRREDRRVPGSALERLAADEPSLSRLFDRAWAKAVVRAAIRRQVEAARASSDDALRRVELLQLRFQEGLPIREIARLWEADPVRLHREYARARREFAAALREVVRRQQPGSPAAIDEECARLAELLRCE